MSRTSKPLRYGVIGLGHIAQIAVLPAFAHCKQANLTALFTDDPDKAAQLKKHYGMEHVADYNGLEKLAEQDVFDALYIALPNHLHCEYTLRAAALGKHVLSEKPLAVSVEECDRMIDACRTANVKLMTAYRLHFEEATLKAIQIANSGKLGKLRLFNSVFSMLVDPRNVRTQGDAGGGTLYDIGVYCINAARMLFRDEPSAVFAASVYGTEKHFEDTDEASSCTLYFSDNRLAQFVSSFGAADVDSYRVLGTKGDLRVEPAYTYQGELTHYVTIDGTTTKQAFAKRDHFAPQLDYFAECVAQDRVPEPSGEEGKQDVRIIQALYQSAREGRRIELPPHREAAYPTLDQEMHRPAVRKAKMVNVSSPHA